MTVFRRNARDQARQRECSYRLLNGRRPKRADSSAEDTARGRNREIIPRAGTNSDSGCDLPRPFAERRDPPRAPARSTDNGWSTDKGTSLGAYSVLVGLCAHGRNATSAASLSHLGGRQSVRCLRWPGAYTPSSSKACRRQTTLAAAQQLRAILRVLGLCALTHQPRVRD